MKMQKETTCLQYHNTVNGQAKSLSGLLVDGLSEREPFQPFGLGYRKDLRQYRPISACMAQQSCQEVYCLLVSLILCIFIPLKLTMDCPKFKEVFYNISILGIKVAHAVIR